MASNYKVKFAVNLTPVIVVGADEAKETSTLDVEIGKTLGGSGAVGDLDNLTMLANGDEVTGYSSGAPAYLSSNGGSGGLITAVDTNNITLIKNTGYVYSSQSTLGAALTKTGGKWTTAESVEIRHTNISGVVIARLYPGEAIVLPRAGAGTAFNCSTEGNTGNIAIEYAMIDDST